jgi:uncharacterized protein YeaO (DUF488 family)
LLAYCDQFQALRTTGGDRSSLWRGPPFLWIKNQGSWLRRIDGEAFTGESGFKNTVSQSTKYQILLIYLSIILKQNCFRELKPMLKIKRVYDPASPEDGKRILIDRLWPRGLKKEEVRIDEWLKEIAPSDELRKWFSHDPSKYQEFKKRYTKELEQKRELVEQIRNLAKKGTVTLLFSAKDTEHNNATALKELLS